jgi:hypothetical protein
MLETQLSKIKVGQQVTVKIDTEEMKSYRNSFLDCLFSRIYTKNHSNERRTSESGMP